MVFIGGFFVDNIVHEQIESISQVFLPRVILPKKLLFPLTLSHRGCILKATLLRPQMMRNAMVHTVESPIATYHRQCGITWNTVKRLAMARTPTAPIELLWRVQVKYIMAV